MDKFAAIASEVSDKLFNISEKVLKILMGNPIPGGAADGTGICFKTWIKSFTNSTVSVAG
tara:strand:+ start:2069 stop:2248 length:180 start_codon:yes stop_codon:yes gene_type:complete